MHAPPPFQLTVQRHGLWHLALLMLSALAMLALGLMGPDASGAMLGLRWLLLAVLLVGAGSLVQGHAIHLRWDGQLWHWGPPASRGIEPHAGHVRVVLDLGPWLLLQLRPHMARWYQPRTWLPVQRWGHEQHWHALRCTVHAARPAADVSTPDWRLL
jgi:hypothetical protein